MERFEKRLKRRIRICWMLIAMLLIAMVVVGELSSKVLLDSRTMDALAQQVSRILFFATLAGLIICIVRSKRLLKRSLDRRERQILEEDERRIAIRRQSGALAMDALLALLMAAVFVLAFVDMTAFHTAFAVLMTAAALKLGFAFYYSKRL